MFSFLGLVSCFTNPRPGTSVLLDAVDRSVMFSLGEEGGQWEVGFESASRSSWD